MGAIVYREITTNMLPSVIGVSSGLRPLRSTLFRSSQSQRTAWRNCTGAVPKQNIVGLTPDHLAEHLRRLQLKETVSSRTYTSLYNKGIMSFHDIPREKISHSAACTLEENFDIDIGTLIKEQNSDDGTRKWLIKFGKHQVETVFIPSDDICQTNEFHTTYPRRKNGTICVSSQVGCTVGCPFCFTGTQKIARNLTSSEIVGQVMTALKQLDEFGSDRSVQNVVFMGQGEPFYNYANVAEAIKLLGDSSGLCFSKKRITVSTSGVVPMITRFANDPDMETVQLAISLHAVDDSIRDRLVPLNKQWPLEELLQACRDYHQKRRIVFEYVMLKGVNDQEEHAHKLVSLLSGMRALVNLIPFNSWPGSPFESSDKQTILRFHEIIQQSGEIPAPIRWPRGDDILAACGQLQTVQERLVGPPPTLP